MFAWKARLSLASARRASRARDWRAAAAAYTAYLHRRPDQPAAWVQLGHSLKEQDDLAGARTCYTQAIALDGRLADAWLHLGHVLKLQHEPIAAAEAYVSAATLAPDSSAASDELAALGVMAPQAASRRLSEGVTTNGPPRSATAMEGQMNDRLDEARRPEFFPIDQYDAYRRRLSPPMPPFASSANRAVAVLIDARRANPAQVRTTLSSLLDQNVDTWSAVVYAPSEIREHSVATLQELDPRIKFIDPTSPLSDDPNGGACLLLDAGVELARNAVAWFSYAAFRTGCVAAYCDHDHCVDDWRHGRTFANPVLQPMFDPDWFAAPESVPAVLFVDRLRAPALGQLADAAGRQRQLIEAAGLGGVAHIPLLLTTVKDPGRRVESAPADPEPAAALRPMLVIGSGAPSRRIQVIIQTRDQPQLLHACIESLRRHMAHHDLVDICIVDNRSVQADTHRLLNRLKRQGVEVMRLNEPFNWSRANNLAAAQGAAPLLFFLNDDTEMLTPQWDMLLSEALAPADVGAVGAELLYPDRTIQHAGMIFGMGSDGPVHEGVGHDSAADGPTSRWRRARTAAAVTGAFLAMRRSTFDTVGGFDAKSFSIAFNDVDICLKCRSLGLRIVQFPRISLIHHESKTRGADFTRSRVAWDLDDLTLLHHRWGAALFTDPGYNPHWSRSGRPFSGFRFPALREVIRHLDHSAQPQPWRISVSDGAEEPTWW